MVSANPSWSIEEYRAEGRGEDASQTCPEDGVMLPQVLPMLAVAAEPFDSPEYCFEIKYDGIRALAAVDEIGWRLWGRERADYTTQRSHRDRESLALLLPLILQIADLASLPKRPPSTGSAGLSESGRMPTRSVPAPF